MSPGADAYNNNSNNNNNDDGGGDVDGDNTTIRPRLSSLRHGTSPLQNETLRQPTDEIPLDLRAEEKDGSDYDESTQHDEAEQQPPPMRFTIDPAGDRTHDKTTVDVVTVPCPGADSLRSWNRDGLLGRYFGALSMRDAEVDRPASASSWVRQGIRRGADVARILLYEHPPLEDGVTLDGLAGELLEQLASLRERQGSGGGDGGTERRPLVFIAHSIGGIVVKMALVKASRDARHESIVRDCYAVVFFGTPHQGSSYFAMPGLASSIQNTLQLSAPLPLSITSILDVGHPQLLLADSEFKSIAHEMRVWTFYETIDSRLSASTVAAGEVTMSKSRRQGGGGVYFTAPLTSIKSAILGMRQERVFPLQSDHANVASFGRQNMHTLRLFLRQLSLLIDRADATLRTDAGNVPARWSLDLEQRVSVEVRGFFEDPTTTAAGASSVVVRAWSTKLTLAEFLRKGPDVCLEERLQEVEQVSSPDNAGQPLGRSVGPGGTFPPFTEAERDMIRRQVSEKEGLGIANQLIRRADTPPTSPVTRPIDSPRSVPHSAVNVTGSPAAQNARVRRLSSPPLPTIARTTTATTRYSAPLRRPSPLIRPEVDQDLAIDRLSPPTRTRSFLSTGRSVSDLSSPYMYRDFPPFSQQRSHSTMDAHSRRRLWRDEHDIGSVVVDDDEIEALPQLPDAITASSDAQQQMDGTAALAGQPALSFTPSASQRKFVWVHLPYNNPTWVNEDYSALYGPDFWASKHTRGRHSQHYAYYAKPGCYFTAPRALSPLNRSLSPPKSPFPQQPAAVPLCLFLPYLHFDSYKRLIRRRELIFQRLSSGRAHPVPEDVAKTDSIELQVIWEYLGYDPPVNCRRSLDQFGYPALGDTRGRDDDQMLYKLTKERDCRYGQYHGDVYTYSLNSRVGTNGSHGSWGDELAELERIQEQNDGPRDGVRNGNVLMVDQLWLWAVDYDADVDNTGLETLISFFPKRESDPIEGPLYQQADLRDSIVNEVNIDMARQCENSFDLAALAALHAVSVLLDRTSHPDLEVFRIFGEAISVLTEKLTLSLKMFRVEGFKDKAAADEPVENRESSIRRRHREEGRRAEKENRDNTSALLELRDLEDELQVLLELFERQQVVLSSMLTAYGSPALRDRTVHGRGFIAEAISRVAEYRRRAEDMTQRVRMTREEYDKLLQMVQRQAQVDEVRLSRLHADLATSQGRSVMIFTVFTIIFLPLSFFTSLFGMNTREWDDNGPLPLQVIGMIALPSSFALIVISLIAAFSDTARRFIFWSRDTAYDGLHWAYELTLEPVVDAALSRWRKRQRQDQWQRQRAGGGTGSGSGGGRNNGPSDDWRDARRGLVTDTSDFWERNRPQRERGYQIPEVNRKKVPNGKKKGSSKGKKDV
ncbi:putative serine esterase (DUF676) [Geosmithia morbida]|uniref:Serine esterase (DUF676) n=1 Tax=Geosmithia morbida TaxID=1094350 RepID=A0A9P4YTD3_9HYPO|nr:putative serine esterase (DUF676) [Geosmithia morbida]KAF4120659.1 putative serine esterase (DUF676) [Geosmithia morbida]